MAETDKRYYWLKLKRDFFKRHDIQIIESMDNGKDYILFYLKLLCESVDHDGNLRFSEQIPYNERMLATITNTNIDIVRSAIKIFTDLHMMDIMDDGTYFMSEVNKMLGSETYWAKRKREQREKNLLPDNNVGQCPTASNESPTCPSKSIEKEIEIDIDKDIEDDISESDSDESPQSPPKPPEPPKKEKPEKPTKHKHGEYQHVLLTDEELEKLQKEYGVDKTNKAITFLDEYIEESGYKKKSHYLSIRRWVMDAVKEQESKKKPQQGVRKNNFNNFEGRSYDMQAMERMLLNSQNQPKTAGDDEGIRARAEALQRSLAQ